VPLRAVIFDFDGVIVDTEMVDYTYWREIYEALGQSLDLDVWSLGIGTRNAFDPYVTRTLDRCWAGASTGRHCARSGSTG
jgi:beta-phosphoglucomutase-like phosphatase (HAD superfamily)